MTVFNNQLFSNRPVPVMLLEEEKVKPRVVEVSTVQIVHISDTHNHLPDIDTMPVGDILIHTGDFSERGLESEICSFNSWLERAAAKYRYRIVLLGNHDQITIKCDIPRIRSMLTHATHVPNLEVIELHGLRILCYPWLNLANPRMHREDVVRWVTGEHARLTKAGQDIHLFCSHAPAKGFMDLCGNGNHAGFDSVKSILDYVQPPVFLFGHVHESHGYMTLKHRPKVTNPAPMGKRTGPRNIGESFAAGPYQAHKQTLLVNSCLCDFPVVHLTQCAHVLYFKRVVTEELFVLKTRIDSVTTTTTKATVAYQLQGIAQPTL